MCCLWKIEKISWNDSIKNQELLHGVKEEKNILHKMKWWKANWLRHILRRYCLVKRIIKGKIERTERRGRRLQQPRDDIKEKRRYWNLKVESQDRTVWKTRFGRDWSMLLERLLLAVNIWTESQETWISPCKRESGLTQVRELQV
jgi:hypothetical protein